MLKENSESSDDDSDHYLENFKPVQEENIKSKNNPLNSLNSNNSNNSKNMLAIITKII